MGADKILGQPKPVKIINLFDLQTQNEENLTDNNLDEEDDPVMMPDDDEGTTQKLTI